MTHESMPLPMRRQELLAQLAEPRKFDLAIVGGGATGLGVALDAALRGFSVVLVESHDFAKGTSSRATKLVHGGVRYLAQGDVGLVYEALRERTTLLRNAPHLAQPLPFVVPAYKWWEKPFYGAGLKMYDALAGKAGLGPTEFLSASETAALLPMVRPDGLLGGIKYWDGQFNDARLALALARSASAEGALLINYCAANSLLYESGRVAGLSITDHESGRKHSVQASCVVNATGVWVDELRQQDGKANPRPDGRPTRAMVSPSQGVHIVVERDFLGADVGLMVPKTADGRVLFAVPWLGKVILGTTDTPRRDLDREPRPLAEEIDFILGESARYLRRAPQRSDARSVWVGLRPLVKAGQDDGEGTKGLSREHTVRVSRSGLVSVTGGKWTTYRAMAEDVLDKCFDRALLERRQGGVTEHFPLMGTPTESGNPPSASLGLARGPHSISQAPGLHSYGSEAELVQSMPGHGRELAPGLTESMVRFAARFEFARTVEDMLARRSRLLFLDARAAAALGPQVAAILREETGADPQEQAFAALACQYGALP